MSRGWPAHFGKIPVPRPPAIANPPVLCYDKGKIPAGKERTLKINEAGSIAEAAVKLNGVFEAAQAAADQYLESVQAANQSVDARLADAEAQKAAILQAAEIVRVAQEQARSITEQAEKESGEQWDAFQRKAEEFLSAHKELSSFIQK